MYIYIYIYTYIHTYMLSSSRKGSDVFVVYGFHRRESRGPVAAGSHTKNQRRKQ